MRLTDITEMARQRTPTWSRYCNVISSDALVIVRMPDEYMRWRDVRQAIFKFMRESYGVKSSNIQIEGLAGIKMPMFRSKDDARDWMSCNRHTLEDDKNLLPKLEKAFSGDPSLFSKFNLWTWNGSDFRMARSAAHD